MLAEIPLFLPVDPNTLPPNPSPFLSVSSKQLETHFIQNPQRSSLVESQTNALPGSKQPPQSPKNQTGQQKPMNKTPTSQKTRLDISA